MWGEPQGRVHRGAEQAHRLAPVVSVRCPGREGIERRHGREVEAGHRGLARSVLGVARKGRVDLPFQGHVLADDDVAGIGQGCVTEGDVAGQGLQVVAIDDQRRVVLAEHEAVGDQLVHGVLQGLDLGDRRIAGGDQASALGREQVLGLVLFQEGEGLDPVQLVGLLHQPGEHLRIGPRDVFLDGQRGAEAAVAGAADLEDLAAEQQAVATDRLAQVVGAEGDPLRAVVQEQAVELGDLGEAVVGVLVDTEPSWAVVDQGRAELGGDVLQLVDAGGQQVPHQTLVGLLGEGDLGAQASDPVHQDQPEAVLVQGAGLLEFGIGIPRPAGRRRSDTPARDLDVPACASARSTGPAGARRYCAAPR